MTGLRAAFLGLSGLALTACSTLPPSPDAPAAGDPYESTNRQTMAFNAWADAHLVGPAVRRYLTVVPEGGRRGVHNFLGNLALPTIFVNDVLQGEGAYATQALGRLAINSTLGLGGFFDPAAKAGLPAHGEDFGQTLAVWGVGEGPYLVLPFLGPSNPRDASGLVVDAVIDPTNQIPIKQHIWWSAGRTYFTLLDLRAQTYQAIQGIQRSSVDYYASLRSLYRQLRTEQIRNGRNTKASDLPDF